MRLVPVFILETYNQTSNECLPKLVQTDNASSSVKKAIIDCMVGRMIESSTILVTWLILSCRLGYFMYWSLIPNHWISFQAGWPGPGKSVWSDKEIFRSQPSTWALHSFEYGNPWNNGS